MSLPTLTYFSSRGRAELIRLVCAEAGIAYEQRLLGVYHPINKTPGFEDLKASHVLPFDAVPFWQEADSFALAQSDAIVRHLARTHGLYGKDPHEAARCDMIFAGVEDTRLELRKVVTTDSHKRADFRDELRAHILPRWLAFFERLLVGNGGGDGFIVGEGITFADVALLLLWENLHDNGFGGAYAHCPKLSAHHERIGARPGLAHYRSSPERFPVQLLPT